MEWVRMTVESRLRQGRPSATLGPQPVANPEAGGGACQSNPDRRIALGAEGPTERRAHIGGLFGNRTRTTQRGPQRGADMEAALHLSFQDAVHGVTTSVNVPQDVRCSNCRGSGAAPGTSTHICPRCGGTGSLNDNQGLFSLSTVCPDCVGRGTLFRVTIPKPNETPPG